MIFISFKNLLVLNKLWISPVCIWLCDPWSSHTSTRQSGVQQTPPLQPLRSLHHPRLHLKTQSGLLSEQKNKTKGEIICGEAPSLYCLQRCNYRWQIYAVSLQNTPPPHHQLQLTKSFLLFARDKNENLLNMDCNHCSLWENPSQRPPKLLLNVSCSKTDQTVGTCWKTLWGLKDCVLAL